MASTSLLFCFLVSGVLSADETLEEIEAAGKNKLNELVQRIDDKSYVKFSGSYTPWLVNWKQKSTSASRFDQDAISVNYAIEDSIAHSAKLSIDILTIEFDLEVIDVPETNESSADNSLSALNMGLNFTELVGDTYMSYHYTGVKFKGAIFGDDNQGRTGTGKFETDANTHEVLINTHFGLGIGYRDFSYDLPQDIYLIHSTNPNTSLFSGFANVEYTAGFYMARFNNSNLFQAQSDELQIGTNIAYGIGKMEVGGDFITGIKSELNTDLVGDADASILEINIYGIMPFFTGYGFTTYLTAGYKSEVITAEYAELEGYSLVTDFETSFSGPYLTLSFSWQ